MASGSNCHERFGLQCFQIKLDQPQHIFYAGQSISGVICIDFKSSKLIEDLVLKCHGESLVHFKNRSAGFKKKCSSEEIYWKEEISLVEGNENEEIDGNKKYSFNLNLPEKLPGSFEGRYGRVRYSLRGVMKIQGIEITSDILSFTILPIFDLNNHPLAPLPISESHSKSFMGHSEQLIMTLFLPVRGYVPGQTIPLDVNVKNESNVVVKKLRVVFKKVIIYRSMENVRKHKEIVVEIDQPVDKNNETYKIKFDVPSVPPSGTICNNIDVGYTLKVEACVDFNEWYYRMFHKNLKIRASIIIGTIPLKNYEDPLTGELLLNNQEQTTAQSHEIIQHEDNGMFNSFNGLKYQKSCIYRSSKPQRDDSIDEEHSEQSDSKFSPMYRVYQFKNTTKDKNN